MSYGVRGTHLAKRRGGPSQTDSDEDEERSDENQITNYVGARGAGRIRLYDELSLHDYSPVGDEKELKYVDTSFTLEAFDPASTPTAVLSTAMVAITKGATVSGRIGDRIRIRSLSVMFHVRFVGPFPATAGTGHMHFYLGIDRQANQAAMTVGDAFDGFSSLRVRVDRNQRYRILKHWVIDMSPQWNVYTGLGAYGPGSQQHYCEFYRKMNLPTIFGASNTIPADNNFFLSVQTVFENTTYRYFEVYGDSRIRYTDS